MHILFCVSYSSFNLLQEVVQRLFDEEEEEQSTNVTEKDCEQRPVQASAVRIWSDRSTLN